MDFIFNRTKNYLSKQAILKVRGAPPEGAYPITLLKASIYMVFSLSRTQVREVFNGLLGTEIVFLSIVFVLLWLRKLSISSFWNRPLA